MYMYVCVYIYVCYHCTYALRIEPKCFLQVQRSLILTVVRLCFIIIAIYICIFCHYCYIYICVYIYMYMYFHIYANIIVLMPVELNPSIFCAVRRSLALAVLLCFIINYWLFIHVYICMCIHLCMLSLYSCVAN
jgi:hypothetical protein